MDDTVSVSIPVSRVAAGLLGDAETARRVGRMVSNMLRPFNPAVDPLTILIAEVKADARAGGLSDADIDAELAAYNAEHRS